MLDCQNHCIPNWVVLLDPTFAFLFFASHAKKKSGKPMDFFLTTNKNHQIFFGGGYIRQKFGGQFYVQCFFCEGCDCCIFSAGIKFVDLAQMFQTVFLNAILGCVFCLTNSNVFT